MPEIDRLTVYPVKGLDGIDRPEAEILDGGTVEYDREFALFDESGQVLNGKRTERVHRLDTDFDPETGTLTVAPRDEEAHEFDLEGEQTAAEAWFSDFFDADLTLKRDTSLGYVDRRSMGPSVISTATLRTVAGWFDDVTVDGARRRLRANVEVSGVPAFWEDRFVGDTAPAFVAGDVRFEGVTPCGRCVVPQRDPDTGEPNPDFKQQFVERREETFPDWADEDAFDHYYTLMIITSVPESDRNETLREGETVEIVEP